MTEPEPTTCDEACRATPSIEALNRLCYCLSVDEKALHQELENELGVRGLSEGMVATHPHLFASLPVFIARTHLEHMARVVEAIERVAETPLYRRTVMGWAPSTAHFEPGTRGGLLGFDFHLTDAGPQLIEINTNPGGALLNAVLARAQRACCAAAADLATAPMEPLQMEQALVEVFREEWRLQRGNAPLHTMAIVDDAPNEQYLYPEFLLFRQLVSGHGIESVICDPRELTAREGRLWHHERPIDFVYNRLTDFSLEQPAHASLRIAYLAAQVVVSPNPHAHALYADKRNLTVLCDATFLRDAGLSSDRIEALRSGIPRTDVVTAEKREAMWANRRHLFFKPATGYGSKAAYRGEKITKRVWQEITAGTYVAQALVAPSERYVADSSTSGALKVDVRNYAYASSVKLVAARLYQGQTTNFRTPGGGFAPVLTNHAALSTST